MIGQATKNKCKKAWFIPGFSICAMVFMSASAFAQSSNDINNRLNRLENDISTLSRAVYRGETPAGLPQPSGDSSTRANTEVRLQQLETEIRGLTGKLETLSFENRQLKADLDRVTADIMLRLQDVEGGGVQSSSQVYNNTRAVQPSTPAVNNAPDNRVIRYQDRSNTAAAQAEAQGDYEWQSKAAKQQAEIPLKAGVNSLGTINRGGQPSAVLDEAASKYEHAFALLKNQQYDQAEQHFSQFLSANPRHVLAGNAKYWLGETHYVRGQYDDAARVFAEGYQQYPKGNKAPDNLLKLGLSLASLGSADDACLALKQLKKEFPNGAGPVLRRAEQEKIRLGCK